MNTKYEKQKSIDSAKAVQCEKSQYTIFKYINKENYLKCCWNKWVLRFDLKVETDSQFFIASGSLFHSTAPAYINERSPYDLSLVLVYFKRCKLNVWIYVNVHVQQAQTDYTNIRGQDYSQIYTLKVKVWRECVVWLGASVAFLRLE